MVRPLSASARYRIRDAAWVIVALAVFVRLLVGFAQMSRTSEFIIGEVITYLLPIAAASLLAFTAAFRVPNRGFDRSNWLIIGTIAALVFASESYWATYAALVDPAGPGDGSWVIFALGITVVLLQVLIVRMTRLGAESTMKRVRFHIDIFIAMTLAYGPVYQHWTLPHVERFSAQPVLSAAVLAIYPVVGLMLFIAGTSVTFRLSETARPVAERLIGSAVLIFGSALMIYPLLYPPALYADRRGPDWFTMLLGVGFDLVLLAAVYRLTETRDAGRSELWPVPALVAPGASYLFEGAACALLVALGWTAFGRGDALEFVPLRVDTAVLAIALSARSWITALQRARARAASSVDLSTGVYSRAVLETRLRDLIDYARETGHELSLVVFEVRDLGRSVEMSRQDSETEAARALVRAVRAESPGQPEVFRVGGDRFAAVCPLEPASSAAAFAVRVWLSQNSGPRGGRERRFRVGAGVATFPVHAVSADDLLAAAEVALSAARGSDSEPVSIYEAGMAEITSEERTTHERMRELRATVRALAEAVDARDPSTRDHSANVSELATALAQVLGLDDRVVQVIGLAALMHDVGKVGISDAILRKTGELTREERIAIEEHAVLSERILAPARLDDILPAVRSHHERWDGEGYPDGLRGEEIPYEARILAVCDAFETMTTGRTYRPAASVAEALAEIGRLSGSQFDPQVASAFARMVRGLSGHTRTGKARAGS